MYTKYTGRCESDFNHRHVSGQPKVHPPPLSLRQQASGRLYIFGGVPEVDADDHQPTAAALGWAAPAPAWAGMLAAGPAHEATSGASAVALGLGCIAALHYLLILFIS